MRRATRKERRAETAPPSLAFDTTPRVNAADARVHLTKHAFLFLFSPRRPERGTAKTSPGGDGGGAGWL